MYLEAALKSMKALLSTKRPGADGRFRDPSVDAVRRLYEVASRAKLITFDRPAHLIRELNGVGERRPDLVGKGFVLPASPVAVEDPGGVTIIEDRDDRPRGLTTARFLVEIQPVTPHSPDNYREAPSMEKVIVDTGTYGSNAFRAIMCEVQELVNVGIENTVSGCAMLPIGSLVFTTKQTYEFSLIHPAAIEAVTRNSSTIRFSKDAEIGEFNFEMLEALRRNVLTAFALLALYREQQERATT